MRQGYTIIELVLVMTIAGILGLVTIPRLGNFIDGISVRSAGGELEQLFHTARHTAILRSRNVTINLDTAGGIITIMSGNDTIKRRDVAAIHGVRMSATRTSSTYSPTGLGYGASNLTVIISRGNRADTLTVSRLGRVRR